MYWKPMLAACLCWAAVAAAGEMPRTALFSIGFREATLDDFTATAQAVRRRADPLGYLAVTADFNGDGKDDEARILLNRDRQVGYVVATVASADKLDTYVLETMSLSDAANVGIRRAERRSLPGRPAERWGIVVFNLDTGAEQANYFDGEGFAVLP